MVSDPALELLHENPGDCLDVHSVSDRGDRSRIPITVDIRIELVSTSRRSWRSVWPSAPDHDGPRSNGGVPDRFKGFMGFIVELGKPISDQVIRDLAAVVLVNEAQQLSLPGPVLIFVNVLATRSCESKTNTRRTWDVGALMTCVAVPVLPRLSVTALAI
ncbi:MAG TPA: hypothetical protein VK280_09035 [Streptosporangiaceae bacterium]|nr:hypothetical protein [Streptosporangiaceae bacterium]